tara:strand:- start:766 stop:1251 length:486 start_codon:yes stop_codon:yes gene_type:complete
MELYFIHYEDKLFATHTGNKTIIIAARAKDKMNMLKQVLKTHHQKNGRIMNRCTSMYPFVDDNMDVLKLDGDNLIPPLIFENFVNNLDVCSLRFDTNHGRMMYDQVQQLSNADMFILSELDYSDRTGTLSLRGEYTTDRPDLFDYDFVEYLNHVYDNVDLD